MVTKLLLSYFTQFNIEYYKITFENIIKVVEFVAFLFFFFFFFFSFGLFILLNLPTFLQETFFYILQTSLLRLPFHLKSPATMSETVYAKSLVLYFWPSLR